MRITHVVRQFLPGVGGLENYVGNLAACQTEAGHAVKVLTLDRLFTAPQTVLPAAEQANGYSIARIPYSGSTKYPLAPGVFKHLKDCDVVHVHGIDFFFDALSGSRLWHGKPMVVSTHGGFFHTPYAHRLKKLFFHTMTRTSLTGYRAVLASSVNDRNVFAQITRRPIDLVENGVDIEKFSDCGAKAFRKHMVVLGRFASHKRLDRTLDFFGCVRARDPDWTLTIIGSEWDLKHADVQRLVDARGLTGVVAIRAGLVEADIAREFADASVIVSASDYEGFGIAIVEGMSAGLLPVTSDIAAFRSLHARFGLGVCGDFGDPAAMASRFFAALPQSEEEYAALRGQVQIAARNYAWPAVAKQIEAIYERVCGTRQRSIFGVPVEVATGEQIVARLEQTFDTGKTAHVAFLNAHGANLARTNRRFGECLEDFLILNDGIGIDLASYWLYGNRFPENLNGTDFVVEYLRRTRCRHKLFLLGARENVVASAAAHLSIRFDRHNVVGHYHGYFSPSENGQVVERVKASGADLLLVGLGNPAQEMWIARNARATGCRMAFGVGALFDFLAGAVPRAPVWVRRCRVEWLFRLWMEPRRLWRRYVIGNASFLFHLLRSSNRQYLPNDA